MTFDFTDDDRDTLRVLPSTPDAVLIAIGSRRQEPRVSDVRIPLDRVEEVIAGIRDAARTAAARQTTGQDDTWPLATPCSYCSHTLNWHVTGGRCRVTAGEASCGCSAFVAPDGSHPDSAVVDEFIRDMATRHPACACTHPQERHLSACTECPCIGYAPTWPPQTTGSEGPDPCSACPTFPCRKCAPAVGQPAEAHDTDLLAACATEYQVPVPEGGGTTLQARRQSLVHGTGWAVSTRAYGGGRAWTAEGWQESISALSVDRLFCWPDAATAVAEARRALAMEDAR